MFRRGTGRTVAIAGAAFGLVFFGLLVSWMRLFGGPAYVSLVLLQTIWVVAALYAGHRLRDRGAPAWLVFPLCFLAGEYLRSRFPFGGFAWGGLGYAAHDSAYLLRLASYTGVWGLTLLMCSASVAAVEAATAWRSDRRRALRLGLAAAVSLLVPGLLPAGLPQGPQVRVAMVQADVPENTDDPRYDDLTVFESHLALTRSLKGPAPSLVVWAENAFDTDPLSDPGLDGPLRRVIAETSAAFLVGAILDSPNPHLGEIQNANLYFRPEGSLADIYVKQRPVPFGERVYFRRLLEPLIPELERVPRDMAAGDEATTFPLGEGRFGSLICYESTYPDLVRSMVNRGAGFLVVSTNNSSYARTAASPQHVAFSQVRAAEHRRWVAHAALSGISAVVAPDGRVVQETRLFEPAVMSPAMRFARHRTFYGIFGDWLPVGSVAALAVIAAGHAGNALARRRSENAGEGAESEDRALVVIPTYNEAGSIEQVLDAVSAAAPSVSVLVVDDASPDGTAELAQSAAIRNPRIQVMQRDSKQGLGSAYISGFQWGLQRQFEHFIEMDADLSHDPGDVPGLIEASKAGKVAVGSRYTRGGRVTGWSAWRHLLSRAANVYAKVLLGLPVNDSTSGFRCYPAQVLRDIALETVEAEGYAFQIEMAYRAHRLGYEIVEVPITFRERASGRSKMSSAIVKEAVFSVARWAIRDRIRKAIRKTS